jgi:thiol-disulfide isomerase/thioredoxin
MNHRITSGKRLAQHVLAAALLLSLCGMAYADLPALPKALRSDKPSVKLTLLEFSAPWCVSCQVLKPELKKLSAETGPALNLVDMNIDKPASQKYVQAYEVYSTPTLILFDGSGKAIQKLENDVSPGDLRKIVLKQLAKRK